MSLFILDTDHASLLQRGNPHIAYRIALLSYEEVSVTTVTAEDTTIEFFKNIRLLDFNKTAVDRFVELRKQKIRIGTMDLRIAAVALSCQAILVTRNRKDFARVPNLQLEDWSGPSSPG